MIYLTDQAAKKIKSLSESLPESERMLRMFVKNGGCSGMEYGMEFGPRKEGDRELENNGIQFLVDEESLSYLSGSEVDFDDGLNGKGFEVRNPNAKSTCGCGRSFQ